MRVLSRLSKISAVIAAYLLTGCQSLPSAAQPAVLVQADDEAIARLKSAVASALGKARVDFGAINLEASPEIPVLPPQPGPFEGQSPALPTYFDLAVRDGECIIIKRSSGEVFKADGLNCKPAA